jgi:hypothetical protein
MASTPFHYLTRYPNNVRLSNKKRKAFVDWELVPRSAPMDGSCGLEGLINAPFGGIELLDRRGVGFEALLDFGAIRQTVDLREPNASVLVDLTEQVLDVDQLQSTASQPVERNSAALELLCLQVGNESDNILVRDSVQVGEALAKPAASAGTGGHKLGFRKMRDFAVVDVDRILIGKEIPNQRV